jgi:hypothetical protein
VVGNVYVTVAVAAPVPPLTPLTIPELLPMVAVAVGFILHVPPVDRLFSIVVCPTQVVSVPVIGSGKGFTVIIRVL